MKKIAFIYCLCSFFYSNLSAQSEILSCNLKWQDIIYGTCIGVEGLISMDINQDGTLEILSSSTNRGVWYIMEYDPTKGTYFQKFKSHYYETGYIQKLAVFDLNGDSKNEILIGKAFGNLEVYDGVTHKLIQEIDFNTAAFNQIKLADANSDGANDLIYITNGNLHIYDPISFDLIGEVPIGGKDFEVGDVDGDSKNEIVFTNGKVVEFSGDSYVEEWDFDNTNPSWGRIELADIDTDGILEIISAPSWYDIFVWDADIQSQKLHFQTDNEIDALTLYDVNGDDIVDLIYGDRQNSYIHCIDLTTEQEIWSFETPNHGITEIAIDDWDNDNHLEIIWGDGCGFSSPDLIHVNQISNQQLEWESDGLEGSFLAVETADVDNDQAQELVTCSYDGVLSIYDATTKELEWRGELGLYPHSIWDLEITDFTGDGDTEIIVLAGEKIRVFNGGTLDFDFMVNNVPGLFDFSSFAIGDVDADDKNEYVVASDTKIHILSHFNIIQWSSEYLGGGIVSEVQLENIDDDNNQEIIFCKRNLYIYDGIDLVEEWKSPINDYLNFDLHDFNGDGKKDIIAAMEDGKIAGINGITHETEWEIQLISSDIQNIKVVDLNGDGEVEYVFSSIGYVYFYSPSTQNLAKSHQLSGQAGTYNGISIKDVDGDSFPEIFLGTQHSVVEIGKECYGCLWFDFETNAQHPTCPLGNDGIAEVITIGGELPYQFQWENGDTTSSISDLEEGTYQVTVADGLGCKMSNSVTLITPKLKTENSTTAKGCDGINDGSAIINILEGVAPFKFEWTSGDSAAMVNTLDIGNYSVTITDSLNCESIEYFEIFQDTLKLKLEAKAPACNDLENGYARLDVLSGTFPFNYEWSDGSQLSSRYFMPAGEYFVTVTDDRNCTAMDSVIILQDTLTIDVTQTFPECNDDQNGEAEIMVFDGNPPFQFQWTDGATSFSGSSTMTYLHDREYYITVSDADFCYTYDTIKIQAATLTLLEQFTEVSCFGGDDGQASILVLEGLAPFEIMWNTGDTTQFVSGLTNGWYNVSVTDSNGCEENEPVFIPQPFELFASFQISGDNPNTPEGEGTITTSTSGGTQPLNYLWSNGETTKNISDLISGDYSVIITDENGCEFFDTLYVPMSVNTSEFESLVNASVLPNPFFEKTILSLEFNTAHDLKLNVIDVLGRVIQSQNLENFRSGNIEVDLTNQASGLFFIEITEEEQKMVFKILKK